MQSYPTVCCYLVWLTWCTVTSTPDTETARDPTDEYFNDRGIQVFSIIIFVQFIYHDDPG